MARVDDLVEAALKGLGPKPSTAVQEGKKRYSEQMSQVLAAAFAEELRQRGLDGTRPAPPGEVGASGAEKRMAGGIGAKKVDVSWSSDEAGLLLGLSVKTINWMDQRSGNFQKNLTNRRGDLLFEATTLHRRFPYAVLGGFLILDKDAATDSSRRRQSTFANVHPRFRLFTGRTDPAGRDEVFELLAVSLVEATPFAASLETYEVGQPETPIPLEAVFDRLIEMVAERNFDFYEVVPGKGALRRTN